MITKSVKSVAYIELRQFHWLAVSLVLVLWALALHAARSTSMVIDEGLHLASGYSMLRTGDYRLVEEHPPFIKAWASFPLWLVPDVPNPQESSAWEEAHRDPTDSAPLVRVAQEVIYSYQPIDRLALPARAMVALLSVIAGATLYRWAMDLGGKRSGILSLFMWVLDPNILAHSSVAGTDLGAATTVSLTLFLFTRWLRRPTAARWLATGCALGLALGTKMSTILLLPTVLVIGLLFHRRRWVALLGLFSIAALVLWALYGFEVGPIPGTDILFPASSHAIPFLRLRHHIVGGHPAFLLGENRTSGWWYYFPVAFALKTPLATQFLLITSMASAISTLFRRPLKISYLLIRWGVLIFFPLLYGISSLASRLNIGYRHLLPILPLMFVFVGQLWAPHNAQVKTRAIFRHISRFTYLVLLTWLALGTLRIAPHYLAFFNELAGGPDNGWRFLADSNTDWGQALKDLAAYQREYRLGPVKLSLFTFLDPAIYGVEYEPIAPMTGAPPVLPRRFRPESGVYAISATTLDGVPLPLPSMYDWFRHREPTAKIGHVMFIYQVTESDGQWVAQCTQPVAPLTPEAITEGFGAADLRLILYDCEQSWVFPMGGESNGWYARTTLGIDRPRWPRQSLHLEWWPGWVKRLPLDGLRLNYVQPSPSDLPPFAIWEWTGRPVHPPAAPEGRPVVLEDILVFLGYDAPTTARTGEATEVLTYWRVLARPARPLSLMLHVTGAGGETPIAVGDGLGVPVDQWEAGDILVQRHRLIVPADILPGTYRLRSGAYWLDTLGHLSFGNQDIIEVAHLHIQ